MAVDASPARRGFRLPMGRSCPPLREGPARRVVPSAAAPSVLRPWSASLNIPPAPIATVRALERELGRQLRARAGARAPRARRPGGRARVAGGERAPRPSRASPGIDAAVALDPRARRARARAITVHGDYDVDGVCSTAILVRVLRGARRRRRLVPAQPHRGRLRPQRARRSSGSPSAARGCCSPPTARSPRSTRSRRRARARARRRRHRPPQPARRRRAARRADRPPGGLRLPVPRPVRGRRRLQARRARCWRGAGRDPAGADEDLDLVALATVADCVPLRGENRRLVRDGPARAGRDRASRACARCMRVAKVDPGALDARAIGFRLAPRINAAGRLYRADAGLELRAHRRRRARRGDRRRARPRQRRAPPRRDADPVRGRGAGRARLGEQPAYVLAGEGWHPGVIGIVASRIAERHHRPCVLLALDGDRGHRLGPLDPGLRPARRARRVRRAPAAPRRPPRGGRAARSRATRSTPSAPRSTRTRRRC